MTDEATPPPEPARTEPVTPVRPGRPRWTPPSTGSMVLGAILVLVGLGWILQTSGVLDLSLTVVLAAVLIVIGATLVLTSRSERHGGLIALGVVLSLVLGLLTAVDIDLRGGVGERDYRPASVSGMRSEYHLAVGDLSVDLSRLTVPSGTRHVTITLGIGQLTVTTPDRAGIDITAHAGMGQVVVFGAEDNGVDVDTRYSRSGPAGAGELVLEVSVGLGQVTVNGRDAFAGSGG